MTLHERLACTRTIGWYPVLAMSAALTGCGWSSDAPSSAKEQSVSVVDGLPVVVVSARREGDRSASPVEVSPIEVTDPRVVADASHGREADQVFRP